MSTRAQQQAPCACSPSRFVWSLDFTSLCPPVNISEGPNTGIRDSVCVVFLNDGTADTDFVPLKVTFVQIFELNEGLEAFRTVTRQDLDLVDGEQFQYTSAIARDSSIIPGGLQMRIRGENDNGDVIINDWIVAYSNRCDVEPFQDRGVDSLGFARFVSIVVCAC
jgi:hypothetical protein